MTDHAHAWVRDPAGGFYRCSMCSVLGYRRWQRFRGDSLVVHAYHCQKKTPTGVIDKSGRTVRKVCGKEASALSPQQLCAEHAVPAAATAADAAAGRGQR